MRLKLTTLLMLLFCLTLTNCKEKQETAEVEEVAIDLLNDEFPEAKEAIMKTMDSIAQSVKDGDLDRLISFHAYGPKFTEFKNGEPRNAAAENENFERTTFGSVSEVVKMGMDDVMVAVYGDVANVTLHSDFHLKFGEDLAVINNQITLLFIKTKDGWRIVHEHHSPLNKEEEE